MMLGHTPIQLIAMTPILYLPGSKPLGSVELSSFSSAFVVAHCRASCIARSLSCVRMPSSPCLSGERRITSCDSQVTAGIGSCGFQFVPSRNIAQQMISKRLAVAITAIFRLVLLPRQT